MQQRSKVGEDHGGRLAAGFSTEILQARSETKPYSKS